MCGIFGMVRSATAAHPERASAAFVELGRLSVERGRDSAGFALANPDWDGLVYTADSTHVNAPAITFNGVTIIKATEAFDEMWDDAAHLPLLAGHRIALGHTRWATQGKRDAVINASPLLVGTLVASHNGDIDTVTVRNRWGLAKPYGGTDTEVLYQALSRDRRDRRKIVETLTKVEGRAALAWLDREKPNRVYLARAALSPLSTAYDAEGNFYWASNPRWFRDIDAMFDYAIGFHTITMVAEGSLLTVDAGAAEPVVEDVRRFTPTCRASDSRLSDRVVWRGFDAADTATDKAQVCHLVAKPAYKWSSGWSNPTTKTSTRTSAGTTTASGGRSFAAAEPVKIGGSVVEDPWFMDEYAGDHFGQRWLEDEDGFTPDEVEQMDRECAMEAYERWIEEGEDPTVSSVLRSATMPSEREAVMAEYDLPSVESFHRFSNLISNHVAQSQIAEAV